ncbi:MAG: hypothetical protein ABTQ25_02065 [Nitrosomonas ureae]
MNKQHTKAHEDYIQMRKEQEAEERLSDLRRRLGITDNSATLDNLLEIAASQRSKEHNNLTTGVKTMGNILGDMIQTATSKAAFTEITETEETYRRRMPQSQSDIRFLNLRELQIKETLNHSSIPALAPAGSPGVISSIAPLVIAQNSRVAQAGATIMLVSQDAKPLDGKDRAGFFWESETVFIQSEPAKFETVTEGTPVTESDSPVFREILKRLSVKQYMFATKIERRRAERFFAGELEEALLRSIALGIADAVDRAMLSRILISGYSDPFEANSGLPIESFSLAKASARGLRFNDLRAIAGSLATGATINQNGQLTASGIQAEFCDAIPETIIGDFKRSAVTIGQEIQLIANRSGANALDGSMSVSCVCEIGTLIPVGKLALPFWKLEA